MVSQTASQTRSISSHSIGNLIQDNPHVNVAMSQQSQAQQVFLTPLLLESVLVNVSTKELLQLRCVNQAWNVGAWKLLRKRESLKIKIDCPHYYDIHPFARVPSSGKSKLELLTETMNQSTELALNFPPCQYQITNLQMRSALTQEFLSKCGASIHALQVQFFIVEAADKTRFLRLLRNLLLHQLPNLRQLRIDIKTESVDRRKPDYSDKFLLATDSPRVTCFLPRMKQLAFHDSADVPVLKSILEAAVNLEDIDMKVSTWSKYKEHALDALVAQKKIHLVTSLNLEVTGYEGFLNLIQRFSQTNLCIKSLFLHLNQMGMEHKIRAGKIVNNLITSSAETLEKLHIFPFFLHPQFHLPRMPKLHSLHSNHYGSCQILYPTFFKISRVFPALKTLEINVNVCLQMHSRFFEESLFGAGYDDQVFTVKSLRFDNHHGEMCPPSLLNLFPNLEFLSMGVLSNSPHAFNLVWSLPHLKKLELVGGRGVEESEDGNENLALQLESAFTGFSKETCKQLVASEAHHLDSTKVESLRAGLSMLDAKCLRELEIKMDDWSKAERQTRSTLLSHVTGQFAFKMCPQVQISIQVFADNEDNIQALINDFHSVLEYVSVTETKMYQFYSSSMVFSYCLSCPEWSYTANRSSEFKKELASWK